MEKDNIRPSLTDNPRVFRLLRNKIHIIKSRVTDNTNSCCYFVERNFGNLLIYPRYLDSIQHEIFKQRGGIYRQLDIKMGNQEITKRLFEIYGAALVLNNNDKDIQFLTEEFGIDMYDHFIDYSVYGVLIFQDKKTILFLNDQFIYDRGVIRDIKTFESVKIDIHFDQLYACIYRGFNHS